jgi:putative Ca2+/H+ antiporter (TMEM165/GDT1 family)
MVRNSLFLSTFVLVFLAELGDKTQVASFSQAARRGDILSVALGASLALICTSLTAVLLGHKLNTLLPRKTVKVAAGLLFILTGIFVLTDSVLTGLRP